MMNIEAINKILTFRPREALDGLEALINDILENPKIKKSFDLADFKESSAYEFKLDNVTIKFCPIINGLHNNLQGALIFFKGKASRQNVHKTVSIGIIPQGWAPNRIEIDTTNIDQVDFYNKLSYEIKDFLRLTQETKELSIKNKKIVDQWKATIPEELKSCIQINQNNFNSNNIKAFIKFFNIKE